MIKTAGSVLVSKGGVHKPSDLYVHDNILYAAFGGGYVVLYAAGGTSMPKATFNTFECPTPVYRNPHGRLTLLPEGPCMKLAPDGTLQPEKRP